MIGAQPDVTLDRPMPQSPDAERAMLGAILINEDAFWRVRPIVGRGELYRDAHRRIFDAMEAIATRGEPIESLPVKEELARRKHLDFCGGVAYISSLLDTVPDVANVERYAHIVAEKARLREVVVAGNDLMRRALDGQETSEEIAAAGALRLSNIGATTGEGPASIGQIACAARDRLEKRMVDGETLTGVTWGLPKADAFTLGIQRGVLTVMAARPRVGKTASTFSTAFAAAEAGHRVLLFQMDMSETMTGDRILAARARVSSFKIRSGRFLDQDEIRRVADAAADLQRYRDRVVIDHRTRDIARIVAIIRREARMNGLDLVFVDHIGHVAGGRGEKRYLEVGDVSRRLIDAAGETNAAVVALSQLGREAENRAPELSDLRESGNLEQDARLVALLDRPALRGEPMAKQCLMRMRIPKNEGETGTDIDLHFNLQTQRVTQDREHGCAYCAADEQQTERNLFAEQRR